MKNRLETIKDAVLPTWNNTDHDKSMMLYHVKNIALGALATGGSIGFAAVEVLQQHNVPVALYGLVTLGGTGLFIGAPAVRDLSEQIDTHTEYLVSRSFRSELPPSNLPEPVLPTEPLI